MSLPARALRSASAWSRALAWATALSLLLATCVACEDDDTGDGGGGALVGGGDAGGGGSDGGGGGGSGAPLEVLDGHKQKTGGSWTVLVYMAADNDLEPFAVQDLLEMAEVGSNDKLHIITQVDRAVGYSEDPAGSLGNFTSTKRVRVGKGGFTELADLGEMDRTKPENLADFIAWGIQQYPGDRIALVLWNHGAGVAGFATDDGAGENATMSLTQIGEAIGAGLSKAGHDRLDLVGFDACLMATFEVAATVAPYAEYLLASEELEPGHGWNWASLQLLRDNPGADVPALGKRIADDFLVYAKKEATDAGTTLSLVDLTLLDEVGDAVDALANQVAVKLPGVTVPTLKAKEASFEYGRSGPNEPGMNAFDLGQLAAHLSTEAVIEAGQKAALDAALAKAVVYKVAGAALSFSSGLTINFPKSAAEDVKGLAETPGVAGWRAMLTALWTGTTGAAIPLFANPDGVANHSLGAEGLKFWGALKAGSAGAMVSATAYAGIADPASNEIAVLLSWPAEFDGATVSAMWNGDYLVVSDGSQTAPAYAEVRPLENGYIIEVPLMRKQGSDEDVLLFRQFYTKDGVLTQQGLYLFDDAGVGQYTPKAGEVLLPLVLIISANGDVEAKPSTTVGLKATSLTLTSASVFANGKKPTLIGVLAVEGATGAGDEVVALVPTTGSGGGGAVCGDGTCGVGETVAACPADCGCKVAADCGPGKLCSAGVCSADPNSCVGRCGTFTQGAPCQCDADCADNGDCCTDIATACP